MAVNCQLFNLKILCLYIIRDKEGCLLDFINGLGNLLILDYSSQWAWWLGHFGSWTPKEVNVLITGFSASCTKRTWLALGTRHLDLNGRCLWFCLWEQISLDRGWSNMRKRLVLLSLMCGLPMDFWVGQCEKQVVELDGSSGSAPADASCVHQQNMLFLPWRVLNIRNNTTHRCLQLTFYTKQQLVLKKHRT